MNELDKIRNIARKSWETCKNFFIRVKKTAPIVLIWGGGTILIAAFLAVWGIYITPPTSAGIAVVLVALQLAVQLHLTESNNKKTAAHNAEVVGLLKEIVDIQKAKNKS